MYFIFKNKIENRLLKLQQCTIVYEQTELTQQSMSDLIWLRGHASTQEPTGIEC